MDKFRSGVRQGDPSSPYLYLICAEILSLMIKTKPSIRGIKMNNNTNLLSQFADDTTLSLDGTEESLTQAIETISKFGSYSGLKMNEQKTMIIWIGSMKGSNVRYLRDRNFVWDPGTAFKIVGIKFSTNIETITKINYEGKLDEIKFKLNKWKKRNLTPIGKIAIIKTLIISKITHFFINIPDPEEKFLIELEKELFGFVWDRKPSKISKITLCKEYSEGGLRMINIRNFITSLKTSIIRKMYSNDDLFSWVENINTQLVLVKNFGIEFSQQVAKNTENPFWKDVIKHLIKLYEKSRAANYEEFLMEHIFYNEFIIRNRKSIFLKEWADHKIIYVHQLLDNNGNFFNYQEFITKYPWCNTDFLTFLGIINSVKRSARRFVKTNTELFDNKTWSWLKKGNKFVITKLNDSQSNPAAVNRWNAIFDNIDWKKVFNSIYTTSDEVKLRWFQYRIVHRIIPTQRYLYIRKLVGNPICNFCRIEEQTLDHLFFECPQIQTFWDNLVNLLKRKCMNCQNLTLSKEFVILGTKVNFKTDKIFNFIILLAKFYIYKSKLDDTIPRLDIFMNSLKKRYSLEKYRAIINENKHKFDMEWLMYKSLITD